MGQTQAHRPDGASVGWVMATLPMPNSVREEGLGYAPQTRGAGYPFSSAESKDQVAGVWDRAKGLGQLEEDAQLCKSATTATTPTSGSLAHLHSEGGGWTALRSGDSAAPSTPEDEILRAR